MKEGLENLTLMGQIEGKKSRGKEQVTYLIHLGKTKWSNKYYETKEELQRRMNYFKTTKDRQDITKQIKEVVKLIWFA